VYENIGDIFVLRREKHFMALVKFSFLSKTLGITTGVTIIIPTMTNLDFATGKKDDYEDGVKYQTLFLLHGGGGDDSEWIRNTCIERYAEENKVAVVMPSCGMSFYVDMAHGLDYWTYISEELPRVLRSMFPLSDKKEDNFVAGFSMGAHGAMSFVIKKPEMFSYAVCMGGVAWSAENVMKILESPVNIRFDNIFDASTFKGSQDDVWNLARQHVNNNIKIPKIVIAVGDKDFGFDWAAETRDYLLSLGLDIEFDICEGHGHDFEFCEMYIKKVIYEKLPLKRKAIHPNK
jgi:putative tributyrin esterase